MVLCKFFQQGTCRFGEYCKFEHNYGNRSKIFNTDRVSIGALVAEDVLAAERGGQWLLSCYGPFREKPCVPDMEDLSPEEVRWEMYQAQKSGTGNQVNMHFQQLCEMMKTKREALKIPSPNIITLLENIQNTGSVSDSNKSNFSFAQPQLGVTTNTSSNVFGQKAFGSSTASNNPFGTLNSTVSTSSVFNRPTATTSSIFGGKPTFGGPSVFGASSTTSSSIFGGSSATNSTPFGGVQNNTPSFSSLVPPATSIFGGSSTVQSTFGQSSAFGGSNQNNIICKPQLVQPNSVFGSGASSSNMFGGNTSTNNSSFDTTIPANSSNVMNGGFFGQQNTAAPVFGGAPAFGAGTSSNFAVSQNTGIFGGQQNFNNSSTPSAVFGSGSNNNLDFGSLTQNTSAFGIQSPASNAFSNSLFVNAAASTVAPTFGSNTEVNSSFVDTSQYQSNTFGNQIVTSSPFQQPTGFTANSSESANIFSSNTGNTASQATFANVQAFNQVNSSTFSSNTSALPATGTSNPFLKSQETIASSLTPNQNPFGITVGVTVIDETAYSNEEYLTDDQKSAFMAEKFIFGKIPLKPPTKALS